MFDDIPNEKLNKKEGENQETKTAPVPSAIEKPSAVEAGALRPKGQEDGVEDIFAGVQTGGDGGERPPAPSPAPTPESGDGAKSKVLIALLAVVVVVLLVTGGVFAYLQFFAGEGVPEQETQQETPQDTTELPGETVQEMPEEPTTPTQPQIPTEPEAPVQPEEPIDTDGDGLTDDQELILGTDPELVDTDEDGLLDNEEVQTYNTNPLNPDTDGDGFEDGTEVENGYNPNGEGTLLELQESSQ